MCWILPVALLLDLLFADPPGFPHPVQGIALFANRLEAPARRMRHPVIAGGLVLALLLAVVLLFCLALLSLPSVLGLACSLYLSWSGLALGGLIREGRTALAAISEAETQVLRSGQSTALPALNRARAAVQMLVSRDTSRMGVDDLYRSLAESVSENFNDAFVAPFFWLCLGGPAALWGYKTVSTMDSMWGYKNERWFSLGKASARLDDVLAYIPARLSVLVLLFAVRVQTLLRGAPPGLESSGTVAFFPFLKKTARQAGQCDSPNAGWPMAAAAWLFNGRSGGPTPYAGEMVDKPLLGPVEGKWHCGNIGSLLKVTGLAGWMTVAAFCLAALAAFCFS